MNSSIVNKSMLAAAIMLVAAFAGIAVYGEDVNAEDTYAVQFEVNGITIGKTLASPVTLPSLAELGLAENENFKGWQIQTKPAEGNTPAVLETTVYSVGSTVTISKATVFVAKIINPFEKVTFVFINEDGDVDKTTYEDKVTVSGANGVTVADPWANGIGIVFPKGTSPETHEFVGWADAEGNIAKVNSDKDLIVTAAEYTAVFKEKSKVAFVANGMTIDTIYADEVFIGEDITIANPSMDNYIFGGWFDAAGIQLTPEYDFVADVTFTAKFTPVSFTVTLMVQDLEYAKQTVLYGQKAIQPFKLEGYDGWTLDVTADPIVAFDFNTPITEDITLFAIAEKVVVTEEITITYFFGDNQTAQHTIVAGNTDVFPTDVAKDGYNFIGWFIGVEQVKDPAKQVFDKDTIVIAQYVLADPPKEVEPPFYETTMGQCIIILALFILGLGLYQANKMGYFAVVKNKLFRKKVEAPVEGEEAGKP